MKNIVVKIFLFINLIFTQQSILSQTGWSHVYTEFPYTRLFCVSETSDGDFVTAGDGMERVFCMKIISTGDLIWKKEYSLGGDNFGASSIIIDSLGNIFLAGDGRYLNDFNRVGFFFEAR